MSFQITSALSVVRSVNQPGVRLVNFEDSRLHKAAQEFEALLVGQMLKSAREAGSDGWLGSGDSTGDDSAMDMAESQLANALTASGGLGLASMIERAMPKSDQNSAEIQELGAKSSQKAPVNAP
jgi:Rod binding domain-containing protein